MGYILIENLEVYAYHGLFIEEQTVGRKFIINISIETNFELAAQNDDINGTINYARVCDIVHEQMKIPSKLLEHVGKRIIDEIYQEFSTVDSIELKISKTNPPIAGKIGAVTVVLNR